MEWKNLLCKDRLGCQELETLEIARTTFEKDIDRIIFSSAFRRLDRKTQVHPLPANDHIHTRLSHSLEVSSVGRSLGNSVGHKLIARFPDLGIQSHDVGAIVQAACLAHDIGNPPFGHSGEEAIRYWFKERSQKKWMKALSPHQRDDFLYFEGNAQGLRIISQLEYNLFAGGMRLTYATLGAFIKYPWTSELINGVKYHKYGCNDAELPILTAIADRLQLIPIVSGKQWCRHPLSYLMEAADDICYAIIDLEDGVEMELIDYRDFIQLIIDSRILDKDTLPSPTDESQDNYPYSHKIALLRGRIIDRAIRQISNTFMRHHDRILQAEFEFPDLISACGGEVATYIQSAKNLARDRIFQHQQKIELEVGAYATLDTLLDSFIKAGYHLYQSHDRGKSLSLKDRQILQLMGNNQPLANASLYDAYMRIIDYIAGMTDNYAAYLAQQLRGVRGNR
jgi:dGTPase